MHTTAEKWDDARKICIQEGTHLLILNSGAEMDAVRSLWAKSPNVSGSIFPEYIYVGIHDRFNEGDYITILGTVVQRRHRVAIYICDFPPPPRDAKVRISVLTNVVREFPPLLYNNLGQKVHCKVDNYFFLVSNLPLES